MTRVSCTAHTVPTCLKSHSAACFCNKVCVLKQAWSCIKIPKNILTLIQHRTKNQTSQSSSQAVKNILIGLHFKCTVTGLGMIQGGWLLDSLSVFSHKSSQAYKAFVWHRSKDGTGGTSSNYINQYHSKPLKRVYGFYAQINGTYKMRKPQLKARIDWIVLWIYICPQGLQHSLWENWKTQKEVITGKALENKLHHIKSYKVLQNFFQYLQSVWSTASKKASKLHLCLSTDLFSYIFVRSDTKLFITIMRPWELPRLGNIYPP